MSVPKIVQDAAERIRRGDKQGAEWVYFQGSNRAELKAVDQHLVEIQHPLAFQAGSQLDRFRSYAWEIAER
jgi:hypothetical protein